MNIYFTDMFLHICQKLETIENTQGMLLRDIGRIKAALIRAGPDNDQNMVDTHQHSESDAFEAFCQQLENEQGFREQHVSTKLIGLISTCTT